MNMPKGFNEMQDTEDYKTLPAGGYICRILDAKEGAGEINHLPYAEVYLDICDGEYNGYFLNKFRAKQANDPNAKYPCIKRMYTEDEQGNCKKFFHQFCSAVNKSGGNVEWGSRFCASIKNAYVGVLFGREQFQGSDGKLYWTTKPRFFRSVETIEKGDFKVPEDTPYDGGYGMSPQGSQSGLSNSFSTQPYNSVFDGNSSPQSAQIPLGFSAVEDSLPFN